MRFLAPLAALILTSATLAPNIAEACGGGYVEKPAPRVMKLARASAVATRTATRAVRRDDRAFVVLQTSVDVGDRNDSAGFVELGQLDAPVELTLLGPSGSRVVSSDRHVALTNSWQIGIGQTRSAMEIVLPSGDHFQIAVAGRARDAQWFSLENKGSSAAAVWWLAKHGITGTEFISVQPVTGTDYEVVEYIAKNTSGFVLRRGKTEVGRYSGSPIGAMRFNDRFFIVTDISGGQLATIEASSTAVRS